MYHSEVRVEVESVRRVSGPIVLAADAAYAMPLATTLRSLTENNAAGWPLDIHVIHDGMHAALQARILSSLPPGSATIRWHQVDLSVFAGRYAVLPHISKMTYARLLLPSLLSDTHGKVLYLDSDILVLGDIARLWSSDLGGQVVGAVHDPLDEKIKAGYPGLEGAPRVARYFNGGVLLMELDLWREARISEKAIDYLDRNPNSPFSDQDAMNFACDGRWAELPDRWNFQCLPPQDIASLSAGSRPAIVHFVTGLKPWKPGSLSRSAGLYDAYRSRTLFARTRTKRLAEAMRRAGHLVLHHSALLRAVRASARQLLSQRCAARVTGRTEAQDG